MSLAACPAPFLLETDYPKNGGYLPGRFCQELSASLSCCLPCPAQQWVYSDLFIERLSFVSDIATASAACCGFMLLSFVVLPPRASRVHYLTVGLVMAVLFVAVAFAIPLTTHPSQCWDAITPNDQSSDGSCAWTGALLSLGALGIAMWTFLRTLWLNLVVCWDYVPGRVYSVLSTVLGVVIPIALMVALLLVTGVSYALGQSCTPNHPHSVETFWAWFVALAGSSFLIQMGTSAYCVWIYVRVWGRQRRAAKRSEWATRVAGEADGGGAGAPKTSFYKRMSLKRGGASYGAHSTPGTTMNSVTGSANQKVQSEQKMWRRARRMLLMQWRTILLTVLVTVEGLYFMIVFWTHDLAYNGVQDRLADNVDAQKWAACLVLTAGNSSQCLHYTESWLGSSNSLLSCFILAALIGIQTMFLTLRWSIFTAWWDLLTKPFHWCMSRRHRRSSDSSLSSLPANEDKTNSYSSSSPSSSSPTKTMAATETTTAKTPSNRISRSFSRASRRHTQDVAAAVLATPYTLSQPSVRTAPDNITTHSAHTSLEDVDEKRGIMGDSAEPNVVAPWPAPPGRAETPPPPPLPLQPSRAKSPRTTGNGPASPNFSRPTTAEAQEKATAAGIANRHRLPSWARETPGTLDLRGPRGGLALNPVGSSMAEGEEQERDVSPLGGGHGERAASLSDNRGRMRRIRDSYVPGDDSRDLELGTLPPAESDYESSDVESMGARMTVRKSLREFLAESETPKVIPILPRTASPRNVGRG